MKKNAFTLAEVLVTLGIIGVIAALTMPSLSSAHQKKQLATQARKACNTIVTAVGLYMADNEIDDLTNSDLLYTEKVSGSEQQKAPGLEEFVDKYFQVAINCEGQYSNLKTGAKCFPLKFSELNGHVINVGNQCAVVVALTDGMGMCFDVQKVETKDLSFKTGDASDDSDVVKQKNNGVAEGAAITIEVDTNGVKGPNIAGRDIFSISVDSRGKLIDPYKDKWDKVFEAGDYKGWPIGVSKLINDGWEMNY